MIFLSSVFSFDFDQQSKAKKRKEIEKMKHSRKKSSTYTTANDNSDVANEDNFNIHIVGDNFNIHNKRDKNNDSKDNVVAKDAALLESIDLSSTMDLHRTNLMRMQVKELLDECKLDIKGRKWTTHAHEYLQDVTKIITNASDSIFSEDTKNSKTASESSYSVKDRADKVVHIEKIIKKKGKNNNTVLTVEPIGCTKSQFGWTKKSGNAQMLPTFSLMIKLPAELFSSKDYLNYRYFDVS